MGRKDSELFKGTLEGIVLARLAQHPSHGYELTSWLREQGFTNVAEGTVYALLVRIEQRGFVDVTSERSVSGPPRKVYSINHLGTMALHDFFTTWSFLSDRIHQLNPREVRT